MKYSVKQLNELIANGLMQEYLFFWGHSPKVKGIIDKSCFSQWWPSEFKVEKIIYKSAEHWMMAKKALLFNDQETHDLIINADTPAEAKKLGRKVKSFQPEIWERYAFVYVVEGNLHKFSQHQDLQLFLKNTHDKVIVEASPVDAIWGIGLTQDDPRAYDPQKWSGTNLLGFALMEVRDKLKNGE